MFVWLSLFACSNSGLLNSLEDADVQQRVDCVDVRDGVEGAFLFGEAETTADREACSTAIHAIGGPENATGIFSVDAWGEGAFTLEQRDWNGTVLSSHRGLLDGDAVELTLPFTGEHAVVLIPEEPDAGGTYSVSWTCETGCDANWSRYPFFMMHGMGTLADDGGLSFGAGLLNDAGYVAYEPRVDPFMGSAARTEQWRNYLDMWRTSGTWRNVHVIAHSMGGVDARRLTSAHDPKRQIATVTTLGTPHHGSPIADITLDVFEEYSWTEPTLEGIADALALFMTDSDNDQDLYQQLVDLSTDGMAAFNEEHPDRDDVWYRSWVGITCGWMDFSCRFTFGNETSSWQLWLFRPQFDEPNDGLVTVESAMWGDVQGVLAGDHFDISGLEDHDNGFEPEPFFLNEAERLTAWERGTYGPNEPQAYTIDEVFSFFE